MMSRCIVAVSLPVRKAVTVKEGLNTIISGNKVCSRKLPTDQEGWIRGIQLTYYLLRASYKGHQITQQMSVYVRLCATWTTKYNYWMKGILFLGDFFCFCLVKHLHFLAKAKYSRYLQEMECVRHAVLRVPPPWAVYCVSFSWWQAAHRHVPVPIWNALIGSHGLDLQHLDWTVFRWEWNHVWM